MSATTRLNDSRKFLIAVRMANSKSLSKTKKARHVSSQAQKSEAKHDGRISSKSKKNE